MKTTFKLSNLAFLIAFLLLAGSPSSAFAEEAAETDISDSATEELEQASEASSELSEPESIKPTPAKSAVPNGPTVYILPLGGELNLKVTYDHPMDFEGNNYIKQVQMETIDGEFLGVKGYHSRSKEAYAEFLVNPKLANFDEVALIAESTSLGTIRTTHALALTPEEELPAELNPETLRLARQARARQVAEEMRKNTDVDKPVDAVKKNASKPSSSSKTAVDKQVENKDEMAATPEAPVKKEAPKTKKRWGIF